MEVPNGETSTVRVVLEIGVFVSGIRGMNEIHRNTMRALCMFLSVLLGERERGRGEKNDCMHVKYFLSPHQKISIYFHCEILNDRYLLNQNSIFFNIYLNSFREDIPNKINYGYI